MPKCQEEELISMDVSFAKKKKKKEDGKIKVFADAVYHFALGIKDLFFNCLVDMKIRLYSL